MNCAVCNYSDFELAYDQVADLEYNTYHPVNYYRCNHCGVLVQRPLPKIEAIETFYPLNYRNHFSVEGGGFFAYLKKNKFNSQAKRLAKHFSKDDRKDIKILEIGYGNGELLKAIAGLGYKDLYGCDFSAKNNEELTKLGINIATANVEHKIPFEQTFDVIILNNVIEHFLNPFSVMDNCYRKLNPGGRVLLFTPNADALELDVFGKFWAGFHAPRHTYVFDQNNLNILRKNIGFNDMHCEAEADPGQWAISTQNLYQSLALTRTKLKNGMAFYTIFFAFFFLPFAYLQNLLKRPTSLFVLLLK